MGILSKQVASHFWYHYVTCPTRSVNLLKCYFHDEIRFLNIGANVATRNIFFYLQLDMS